MPLPCEARCSNPTTTKKKKKNPEHNAKRARHRQSQDPWDTVRVITWQREKGKCPHLFSGTRERQIFKIKTSKKSWGTAFYMAVIYFRNKHLFKGME
jgi:hypothetical protein